MYFFKKDMSLEIKITITKTVSEVIREIIDSYMENKSLDVTLMKFFKYSEGNILYNPREINLFY